MATYKNSFENFADGATLVASGSAAAGETAFEVVNAGTGVTRLITATAPAHGTKAANLATSTTSATVYVENSTAFGTLTDVYCRFYLKLTAAPPATSRHLSWRTSAGACTELALTTGRQFRILNVSASTAGTLSTAIPLNQWVRLEFFAHLDGTTGSAELRLYLDPDATTASDSVTVSGQNFRAPATIYRLGITTAIASMPSMFLDGLGFSDTTWLGPADLKPVLTMPGATSVAKATNITRTASATDPEGTAVSYVWTTLTKPTGSTATLTNASTATVTFNADRAGIYVLQCVATDATGKSSTGTTQIAVNPDVYRKIGSSYVAATMTRKS